MGVYTLRVPYSIMYICLYGELQLSQLMALLLQEEKPLDCERDERVCGQYLL